MCHFTDELVSADDCVVYSVVFTNAWQELLLGLVPMNAAY